MSILDVASQAPTRARAKTPTTFSAMRDPVHDEITGRTYQLVRNDKNGVPAMLSCEGNHPGALKVHNERARLSYERKALDYATFKPRAHATNEEVVAARAAHKAALQAERDDLTAKLAALTPATVCERTPYVTRGLTVYAERGIE